MRRPLLAVPLLAAVLALGAGACAGDGGTASTTSTTAAGSTTAPATDRYVDGRFASVDGRFAVDVPSRPRALTQQEPVGQDLVLTVHVADVPVSDTEAYQISYVDYPASLGGLEPAKVLAGAVDGAVARTRGTLEERTELTYLEHPAVDARISTTFPVLTRTFLVDRRLYTIQQVGPPAPTDTYRRMLESFRLT